MEYLRSGGGVFSGQAQVDAAAGEDLDSAVDGGGSSSGDNGISCSGDGERRRSGRR